MLRPNPNHVLFPAILTTLAFLLPTPALPAEADLSDNPLSSATTADVKPNILFVLDDSGSMNWRFMPDGLASRELRVGFRNHRCNLIYYNPNVRYVVPKTSTGGDVNSGTQTSFAAAYENGYASYGFETRTSSDSGATWTAWSTTAACTEDTSGTNRRQCRPALLGSAGSTADLSTSYRASVDETVDSNSNNRTMDTAQPAYYWQYLGSTTLVPLAGDCEKSIVPYYTVNGATYASGVATFQTSTAHGFAVGNTVGVRDVQPSGYRKFNYVVTEVPDATHFKAALASNPGAYTNAGSAWNATLLGTITEYCTDGTTTTTSCAAAGKTALWRKIVVSSASGPATADINGDGVINASDADERQNFANWYSYYSNRMKTMKAAAGRAFVGMTDSKRIGFITINPNSPVTSNKFMGVKPFDTASKADWFGLLYTQATNGSTPLREALSRAGRYFAHETDSINDGMADDPVEYSCQQNFTILTTDGYWNGNGGLKLDGSTAMDNQDGVIAELDAYRPTGSKYAMSPRPIYDGASTTYTWNTAELGYQNVGCNRQQKKVQQTQASTGGTWEEETTQLQKKTGQLQWRTNQQRMQGQLQYQSMIQSKTGQLQWTTDQQRKTGQLQYKSKIQSKTGQLQWTTDQQRKTGQLQWTTNQQSKTGQLQYQSMVQSKTGQLQWTTDQQVKSGQLQYSTTLQRLQGQLQARTFVFVFPAFQWTAWSNVSTCDEVAGLVECRIDPAAVWTYTTSTCTPTRTGVPGSYSWTGGSGATDCQTTVASAWTNTSTCDENANVSCQVNASWAYVTTYPGTCTPTYTGTFPNRSWIGGASARDCQTAGSFNTTWTNNSVCVEGTNTQCRVNASFVKAQTCTPTRTGSPGSYSWTGNASAVDCQTLGALDGTWTNTSTCNENGGLVSCRVGTGSFAYVTTYPGTCTPSYSGTAPNRLWTGNASAVDCQTAGSFNATWTNNTVCTESAITQCRINSATWSYVTTYPGTCTPTRTGSPGSYAWTGGASAVDCQTAGSFNTTWTNNSVCVEATNTQCRVNASWAKAISCTPTRTGSPGSYSWTGNASAIDCQNTGVLDATWTNTSTCNESSDVACQINSATWSYITTYPGTCTPTRTGSPGSYAWTGNASAVDCQTAGSFNTTWTNNSVCVEGAITNCRVNASFVKAQSCTPTRTGSPGSYSWTGNSSAVDCNNTGILDGTWTNASTCNESSDVACRVNGTWGYVSTYPGTCTPTRTGSPGSYAWTGNNAAVDCQTVAFNPTWTNRSTCDEGAITECQINASWAGAPSCTATRTGSPGSYAWTGNATATDCQTVTIAAYHTVPYACTTASIGNDGVSIQCQFVGGSAFADATSCVEDATTTCQLTDLTGWVASDICVANATPDASGQITLCQDSGASGFKLQSSATTTATTYSGPNQTGTVLGTPLVTPGPLTDVTAGACYATAPAVPATAPLVGAGPPVPPDNCTGGSQVWPCETYSAGSGSLTATISGAVWNPPGVDPVTEPSTATYTTSAAHGFLVGHSVTIAGVSPSGYRGNAQIIEVADNTHFKILLETNPGAYTGSGTASLFAGSSNSLADIAQYYYKTDLRNSSLGNCTGVLGTSVCEDNVPSTGSGAEDDRANWQHMTTFTMGLGLTGTVAYSPNYRTDQCVAKGIASATWSSNFVTVTTTSDHGFYVNEAVTIGGGSNATYRGQYRIADIPSTTTFRYALSTNPGGTAFGTGTATGCPDFNRLRTGTINWPVPAADSATALDDLWHAAVNGRGIYFSAGDPDSVVSSLSSALAGINARVAAAAAAATSNLEPVAGDNFAYTAKYKTQAWTGDLEAREIDLTTGAVSGTVIWSAQEKLDLVTKSACDNRNIKLFRSGATNNLVDFTWNTYACNAGGVPTGTALDDLNASEKANFDSTEVALLSHYSTLGDGTASTVDQRTAAAGASMVNFLRGQRGKEGFSSALPITNTDINKLYRTREHVLGDIVNAQPVFVRGPFADYDDTGYASFKSLNAARTPIVYAAANDGMLHAFYAGTSIVDTNGGVESWAFIPTMVLPNLYKLASENYATGHAYSVDGTPVVGDVVGTTVPSITWKTILVSGLNKGGKGYYALDITDPATPKALWEFKHDAGNCVTVDATTKAPATDEYSDCHIGYTYSNPVISKLRDGRWVVFVTSGYNNVNSPSAPGDGVGYLYVLEAMTGRILYKIDTGVGSAADPSGLNHISAWVDGSSTKNNQTERVYGVDLKGNVWRFDVNDILNAAGREATRVATVVDSSGNAQPITTRPELALVMGATYVYVGTGRYLGTTDLADTQGQSIWALRDTLSATALSSLRTNLRNMQITNQGSGTSAFRTVGCISGCASADGWFADLPDTGERVNIDMKLQLGTLVVASNVPESNACNIGGYAWLNYFNNATGEAVANSADAAVGRRLVGTGGQESLAVGLNIVRLPSGKTVVIATTSAAQQLTVEAPFDVPPPTGKRVSWREIVQ